jgi:hypothetical protein
MSELRQIKIRISETRADETGSEEVTAIISNDFAKDNDGQPVYDKEFSYKMEGFFLHAPIPKGVKGGFKSAEEAETAARQELQKWRSGGIPSGTNVTVQEYFYMTYYSDPYLQHLTHDELSERFKDINNNLFNLTKDRKLGIIPMNEEGHFWNAVLTHVIAESGLRGGFYGNISDLQIPDFNWVGIDKVADVFQRLNLKDGSFLVKYSKMKYLKPCFDNGKIRIAPASSYDDSSLNRAIKDDELQLTLKPSPRNRKNEAVERFSEDLKNPVHPIGNVVENITAPSNYYVYCMASEFSLRLFPDFGADGCLIITKPEIFMKRLIEGVLEQLPNWEGFGIGVNYIDPVNTTKEEIDIFYSKDFKFAYQKEYRLIWKPRSPVMKLDYIEVELGNLSDCCELISLVDLT